MKPELRFTLVRDLKRKQVARKQFWLTALAASVHVLATVTLLLVANHHKLKMPKWYAASKGMHNMQRHKRHRKGLDLPFSI